MSYLCAINGLNGELPILTQPFSGLYRCIMLCVGKVKKKGPK